MPDKQNTVSAGHPDKVTAYSCYVLFILLVCNILNYLDRQIVYIVFESLKSDFKLSDSQLGLLVGFGFSSASACFSLVLARLADRVSRVWVVSGAVFFWSVMTALGGFTQNYAQLLLSRMSVAIGQAGCIPPTYAILSDIFPVRRRATAIGVIALATPAGGLFSLSIGGWLNDTVGWRMTLISMGLPGIALALIMLLTLRGPRMHRPAAAKTAAADEPAAHVVLTFMRTPAFRNAAFGAVLMATALGGVASFSAAFLIRTQGLTASQAGLALGLMAGACGVTGALLSGVVTDWAVKKGAHRVFLPTMLLGLISVPLLLGAWLAPTARQTIAFLVLPSIVNYMFVAPTITTLQLLSPPQHRALAVATLTTMTGLIGSGAGPTLVGVFSDLFISKGVDSLRYALCLMVIPYLWAMTHFALATRALARQSPEDRPIVIPPRAQAARPSSVEA